MTINSTNTSNQQKPHQRPFLGFGLGLRPDHYQDIINQKPKSIEWFEVIAENYLGGGRPRDFLFKIREDYPMVMHGVSMSIGSTDELNMTYLRKLKSLAAELEVPWFSDHLCWTGMNGKNLHDLLPLPYTDEAIKHVASRIRQVMDIIEKPMIIENLSSYITYKTSAMSEWEFYNAVVEEADCGMLLDINNIYVSSFNHEFNPIDYINSVPIHRVYQFHLAGHSSYGDYLVDTHDHPVIDQVWDLYEIAVKRFGAVSTMIERDDNIPPLDDVVAELEHAKSIAKPILEKMNGSAVS